MSVGWKPEAYLVLPKVGFKHDFNPPTSLNTTRLREQKGKQQKIKYILYKTSGSVPHLELTQVCFRLKSQP